MSDKPCSCFNQWLEKQPVRVQNLYEHLPQEELTRIINAWNAGWHEGWEWLEYWLKEKNVTTT